MERKVMRERESNFDETGEEALCQQGVECTLYKLHTAKSKFNTHTQHTQSIQLHGTFGIGIKYENLRIIIIR